MGLRESNSLMPEKKKRNWKEYNESLVRRGELLFDTDFLSGWSRELGKLKRGRRRAQDIAIQAH